MDEIETQFEGLDPIEPVIFDEAIESDYDETYYSKCGEGEGA